MGAILSLKTHRAALILSLVVFVVVGAGAALAGTLTSQQAPSPESETTSVPTDLSSHLAVLTAAPSAAVSTFASADAEEKGGLEGSAGGAIFSQYGLNPALAREVAVGSQHLWLIPGRTGLGIHDFASGSGGATSVATALAGNLILDLHAGQNGVVGGGLVIGVAADGNSDVVVHDADGSSEKISVEHNVYVVTHPGAVSVELADGSGTEQSVEVPG